MTPDVSDEVRSYDLLEGIGSLSAQNRDSIIPRSRGSNHLCGAVQAKLGAGG